MKIVIACDHAGYTLKEKIKAFLNTKTELTLEDYGPFSTDRVDYPDYGSKAAQAVKNGLFDRAILICKTGIGMSIVANKFKNIRAALCHDRETIIMSRKHNDANILVLGAYIFENSNEVFDLIMLWLTTEFEGGRHADRIAKIKALES
jgi:RpiB/LacA/LacB family sugar-phosphate isomerase